MAAGLDAPVSHGVQDNGDMFLVLFPAVQAARNSTPQGERQPRNTVKLV